MKKIVAGSQLDFLSGGGEMGERIRNFNWQKTPLGPPGKWESSLKTCVRIMLTSPQPMFVWWGEELINIYNDAYRFVLGGKHPGMLGVPGNLVWKEIWTELWSRAKIVFEKNEGTFDDALLLVMNRHGYDEETYFKFSYNPVPGTKRITEGLFCVCTEETHKIINERALATLRDLGTVVFEEKSLDAIYRNTIEALAKNNKDFPFALIYTVADSGKAVLAASTGMDIDQNIFPETIDTTTHTSWSQHFCKAYLQNKLTTDEIKSEPKNIPTGYWQIPARQAVHIPINVPNKNPPYAIITAALNPFRRFDTGFQQFCQLIGERVSLEINKMLALEEETEKARVLAELDKAKTVFFSNISHEFRTPLTLLLGTVEEALHDPHTTARNLQRLTVTHRNAMRLLRLVNTLLDFSRIQSGRQKATYALTDISTLTRNLASNFRSIAEKAGLKFLIKADTVIQPVYLDQQMWEKIVFNLLSNAFKYTLEGTISLQLFSQQTSVVLEVKDTGIGIPEKELPHIFDRFHRVESSAGRTFEGSGIGLSLVKELVELHRGTVEVKSEEGKGSVFAIRIPFGKEHLPAGQISDVSYPFEDVISNAYIEEATSLIETRLTFDEAIVSKDDTVLIVDDNADMRQYIQSLLHKDYKIVTAANGLDALHKISTNLPSVVVSDIMMPVMDGTKLLKAIREDHRFNQVPVIFLTARAGEESKIDGYEMGADDYLTKPFSAKELKARIDAQINLRHKREEALNQIYSLFNDIPFAVAVLKGESMIIEFINKYNLDIWQVPKEQVIGKPLFEVRPDLKSVEHIHNTVYATGKRFASQEIPVPLLYNGKEETRYFNTIIDPMFDEKGKLVGLLATSIDVTELVQGRKIIEESEQKLKRLKDQLDLSIRAGRIGIWHLDVERNYLHWSKEQCELFGVSEQEFTQTAEAFWEFVCPDDVTRLKKHLEQHFARQEPDIAQQLELYAQMDKNGGLKVEAAHNTINKATHNLLRASTLISLKKNYSPRVLKERLPNEHHS